MDTTHLYVGFIFILCAFKLGISDFTSKSCYGVPGLSCTRHDLLCPSGRIALKEAFYTRNSKCRDAVSDCGTVGNTDSLIVGNDKQNFTAFDMNPLFSNCSFKHTCRYQASRIGTYFTLSVVIYECINPTSRTTQFTETHSSPALYQSTVFPSPDSRTSMSVGDTSPSPQAATSITATPSKSRTSLPRSETSTPLLHLNMSSSDSNVQDTDETTIIIAVVVSVVGLLCFIVLVVYFVIRGKGKRKSVYPDSPNNETELSAGKPSEYCERKQTESMANGYDYVSADVFKPNSSKTKQNNHNIDKDRCDDYGYNVAGQFGQETSIDLQPYSTASSKYQLTNESDSYEHADGDYNHIGNGIHENNAESSYNTAHAKGSSGHGEDSYGYNHLGYSAKGNEVSNVYDTTSAASRDVVDEDDTEYDHVQRQRPKETPDSTYDTTVVSK